MVLTFHCGESLDIFIWSAISRKVSFKHATLYISWKACLTILSLLLELGVLGRFAHLWASNTTTSKSQPPNTENQTLKHHNIQKSNPKLKKKKKSVSSLR